MPITLNGAGSIGGLNAGGLPNGTVTSDTLDSSAIYLTAPAGAVCFVAQSTAPTGWLKANGAAVSRTTYAALFGALGTTFGAGDGSTTFNLPDLRGEFVRGWADGRAVDTGRTLGTAQAGMSQINPGVMLRVGSFGGNDGSWDNSAVSTTANVNDLITAPNGTSDATYPETRPRNIALLAIIKF